MKLIVREHINAIAEPVKKVFSVTIDAVNAYGRIPSNIGLLKGDIIAFRGEGDPVRLPVGSNGKVLTADPTQPTGMRWTDAAGGGSGTKVLLKNGSGTVLSTGAILYVLDKDISNEREAVKAQAVTDQKLYIVAEDAAAGADVDCYCIPGTICQVLVNGACDLYDPLVVSGTPGVAVALPGGTPTVGIAMETKSQSGTSLVNTLLIEQHTTAANNSDNISHANGTVYEAAGGYDTDSLGHILPNLKAAKNGHQPVGVQANQQSSNNSPTLIHSRQGEKVRVMADTTEIQVGDWLVPSSSTAGYVRNGSGYGIGMALSAKASGSVGMVDCLLHPRVFGTSPRAWWLVGGITEDQVVVAYQFVQRASEADALMNVNNGTEYTLVKSGDSVVWSSETGFTIPGTINTGLANSALSQIPNTSIYAAAFGFSGCYTGDNDRAIGGIGTTFERQLALRPTIIEEGSSSGSYGTAMIIQMPNNSSRAWAHHTDYEDGVLSGNWGDTLQMYHNGIEQSLTQYTRNRIGGNRLAYGICGNQRVGNFTYGSFTVTAIVFYSTALTALQHQELSANIRALGGAG